MAFRNNVENIRVKQTLIIVIKWILHEWYACNNIYVYDNKVLIFMLLKKLKSFKSLVEIYYQPSGSIQVLLL